MLVGVLDKQAEICNHIRYHGGLCHRISCNGVYDNDSRLMFNGVECPLYTSGACDYYHCYENTREVREEVYKMAGCWLVKNKYPLVSNSTDVPDSIMNEYQEVWDILQQLVDLGVTPEMAAEGIRRINGKKV